MRIPVFFSSCLLAAILAGCSAGLPTADEGVARKELIIGNGAEPKSIDPHIATGVTENRIISCLIEGLISYHPTDDNIPAPGVAERWESNEDDSVWTFFLREDAQWSNGDPVTAHDFVYSYQRMLTPELGAEYVQMMFLLKNGREYYEGTVADFDQVGVRAISDRELRFELIGPATYFPNMLKHYSWFPVHPPTIEAHGGSTDRDESWTRVGSHVGNGAFVLKEWKQNQYIKVVPSATYWDRETVKLNAVYFLPIEDDNAEKRMFDAGLMHVTSTVPTNDVPLLKESRPEVLRIDPYLGVYFARVNVTRSPFDNQLVRQALALAVDREALVEKVTLADQMPTYGFVPSGLKGYETPRMVEYNPDRARELLAKAGFPGGEGFPTVYYMFNTSEGHRKIAEALGAMWRDELSIDMRLENKEWKVYLDAQSNLDYDLSRSGWIGDYPDPITFLELFTTGNGNNDTGWGNEAYDAAIARAFRTSGEEHYRALLEAERILLTEMPVIPLYWYTRVFLIDPRVKGWHPKLLDNRPYKHLDLTE